MDAKTKFNELCGLDRAELLKRLGAAEAQLAALRPQLDAALVQSARAAEQPALEKML